MMASTLLEQLNTAIDQRQTAALNGARVHHADLHNLQEKAKALSQLIATDGDHLLNEEEQLLYSWE